MRRRTGSGSQRQADGIRVAKARGAYTGAARKLTPTQVAQAHDLVAAKVPKTEIARQLGIHRSTLYRTLATPPGPASVAADNMGCR